MPTRSLFVLAVLGLGDVGERFSHRESADGRVRILWSGRVVTTLRGAAAMRLLERVADADPESAQLAMAKATGNFKRGNERLGRR